MYGRHIGLEGMKPLILMMMVMTMMMMVMLMVVMMMMMTMSMYFIDTFFKPFIQRSLPSALVAVQAGFRTQHIKTVAVTTVCRNATHSAVLHAVMVAKMVFYFDNRFWS